MASLVYKSRTALAISIFYLKGYCVQFDPDRGVEWSRKLGISDEDIGRHLFSEARELLGRLALAAEDHQSRDRGLKLLEKAKALKFKPSPADLSTIPDYGAAIFQ